MSDLSPLAELESLEVLLLNNTGIHFPPVVLKNLPNLDLNDTQVSDLSPLPFAADRIECIGTDVFKWRLSQRFHRRQ